MTCEYCNVDAPKTLLDGMGWCVLLAYDYGRDVWTLSHEELTPPFGGVLETAIDVTHCPMCGRKLGIEVDA
jgi:hypothetical protein